MVNLAAEIKSDAYLEYFLFILTIFIYAKRPLDKRLQ